MARFRSLLDGDKILKATQTLMRFVILAGFSAALGGCADMTNQQQRILSGGAIGAAAGVALTAATGGGNLLVGALAGGAGGAAIGALTK